MECAIISKSAAACSQMKVHSVLINPKHTGEGKIECGRKVYGCWQQFMRQFFRYTARLSGGVVQSDDHEGDVRNFVASMQYTEMSWNSARVELQGTCTFKKPARRKRTARRNARSSRSMPYFMVQTWYWIHFVPFVLVKDSGRFRRDPGIAFLVWVGCET
jgi:hypothetical protein